MVFWFPAQDNSFPSGLGLQTWTYGDLRSPSTAILSLLLLTVDWVHHDLLWNGSPLNHSKDPVIDLLSRALHRKYFFHGVYLTLGANPATWDISWLVTDCITPNLTFLRMGDAVLSSPFAANLTKNTWQLRCRETNFLIEISKRPAIAPCRLGGTSGTLQQRHRGYHLNCHPNRLPYVVTPKKQPQRLSPTHFLMFRYILGGFGVFFWRNQANWRPP